MTVMQSWQSLKGDLRTDAWYVPCLSQFIRLTSEMFTYIYTVASEKWWGKVRSTLRQQGEKQSRRPKEISVHYTFDAHDKQALFSWLLCLGEWREGKWGGLGRGCFKKGVGINYSTQETCRTNGYCLGLAPILVMYWQTLPLISLRPGVIKKQGPDWGAVSCWTTAL